MLTHLETSPTLPPKYLQDDKLTQECFWHPAKQLQGVIACQKHFEAQNSDIFLVTTPKYGTTWLKAIVFALVKRMHYRRGMENHPLFRNNPHDLVPFLDLKIYVENKTPDLSSFASPRLFATHLPFNSLPKSCTMLHARLLFKNPKDTFVSIWHFSNKLRLIGNMETNSLEDVLDRFCKGVSNYGPFWDHVLGYWKESLENPNKEEFLTLCSFGNLRNLEVNKSGKLSSGEENEAYFRRGEVGDWKNFLTAEMVDRINSLAEEKFGASRLKL
ncbi:hypothetical protein ACH5RR_030406 [Cinchona calisaya]|uniref:Sulfotransferase n=2 Tax=Cinchona calisaya TaxID=153742 RepID=A0ABD2YY06_9GENT